MGYRTTSLVLQKSHSTGNCRLIMLALADNDGDMYFVPSRLDHAIARFANIDEAALPILMARLEKMGEIVIHHHQDDSREYQICLCWNLDELPPKLPQVPQGKAWKKIQQAVFERDSYTCKVCGAHDSLSVDHMIPRSKGGTSDMSNLQTLCMTCNRKKKDRLPPVTVLTGETE